jgi:putative ABC transport system permease protein
MRTVLRASLRHHTRRYVASSLAVVIGVAFVVITGMLTHATRSGLTADVGAQVAAVDHVVRVDRPGQVDRLMAAAAERGDLAGALGYAMEPVRRDGVQLARSAYVAEAATDPSLQWQQLESGRFPTGPGEALADVNAAKSTGVEVGDVLDLGTAGATTEVTVVGTVDSPAALGADLYVPWADLRRFQDTLWVQDVAWGGPPEVATALARGATVESADDWVAARQAEISRGVDVIAVMALLFVAIALFVSVMVIANTFSILFAQRSRDFALLRCVGVTRRQLRRAVRVEALVLGVAASLLGIATGALAGVGLVALAGRWFDDMGAPALDPAWVGAAFAVGVAVTLGAAWLPTRSVVRVAPLAALRPDTGVDVRSAAGRVRVALAVLALLGGAALLAGAVAGHALPLMLAGGSVVFTGVLLVGPLLVPALLRAAGRLLGTGPVRRLAAGNAVRNPRRTATTAASLLVGVTLTTAVLTGLASSRTALAVEMDESYPLDATVTAIERPVAADSAERASRLEGVADAVRLDGVLASVGDLRLPVVGVASRAAVVRGPDDLAPPDGTVLLPYEVVEGLPGPLQQQVWDDAEITVGTEGRRTTLAVVLDSGWGRAGLVSPTTLASLTTTPEPLAVWVRAARGADAEDLEGDLAALAAGAGAGLDGGHGNREWVDLQVDVLTGAAVGLLGVAVLIALVGIANTLGLSVLERARENALLRAMGLTRRQLRQAMATEGLLLSMVATALGTALGLAFAWVGVQVMVSEVVTGAGMTVPFGQLVVVALVAAVAGLVACVVPARRAGRIAPAAGLALD